MQGRKMWQALPIIAGYVFLSALIAFLLTRFFGGVKWGVLLGVGVGIMVVALFPLLFWKKHPLAAFFTLFLNALSCGALIGAFFIGTKTVASLPVFLLSAFLNVAAYAILALLLNLPLKKFRAYRTGITGFWTTVLFAVGGALWGWYGAERYAAAVLLFIGTFMLTLGSLSSVCNNKEELFAALALPSSLAVGIVAVIVICLLAGDGDCDCDGCFDGSDCLDCTPDYTQAKRRNPPTMSAMSDPTPPIDEHIFRL